MRVSLPGHQEVMRTGRFSEVARGRTQQAQATKERTAVCGPIPLRFQGGEAAQRPGWLVKGRVASLYARVALLILFEITNHPVCAAEERGLFINGAAQPPLLEKEGNGPVSQPLPSSESRSPK